MGNRRIMSHILKGCELNLGSFFFKKGIVSKSNDVLSANVGNESRAVKKKKKSKTQSIVAE